MRLPTRTRASAAHQLGAIINEHKIGPPAARGPVAAGEGFCAGLLAAAAAPAASALGPSWACLGR